MVRTFVISCNIVNDPKMHVKITGLQKLMKPLLFCYSVCTHPLSLSTLTKETWKHHDEPNCDNCKQTTSVQASSTSDNPGNEDRLWKMSPRFPSLPLLVTGWLWIAHYWLSSIQADPHISSDHTKAESNYSFIIILTWKLAHLFSSRLWMGLTGFYFG